MAATLETLRSLLYPITIKPLSGARYAANSKSSDQLSLSTSANTITDSVLDTLTKSTMSLDFHTTMNVFWDLFILTKVLYVWH